MGGDLTLPQWLRRKADKCEDVGDCTDFKHAADRIDELEAGLRFYAEQWEQDVDAERTATGWEGTLGRIEPTEALLEDFGTKARALLNEGAAA